MIAAGPGIRRPASPTTQTCAGRRAHGRRSTPEAEPEPAPAHGVQELASWRQARNIPRPSSLRWPCRDHNRIVVGALHRVAREGFGPSRTLRTQVAPNLCTRCGCAACRLSGRLARQMFQKPGHRVLGPRRSPIPSPDTPCDVRGSTSMWIMRGGIGCGIAASHGVEVHPITTITSEFLRISATVQAHGAGMDTSGWWKAG